MILNCNWYSPDIAEWTVETATWIADRTGDPRRLRMQVRETENGRKPRKIRQLEGVSAIEAPVWFRAAINENARGRGDVALDIIYDKVDEWLREGRFTECGNLLHEVDVDALPTRVILALAITTRPASDLVPYRKEFFDRAWKALVSRGKDAEKLLGRLRFSADLLPKKRPSTIRRIFGLH